MFLLKLFLYPWLATLAAELIVALLWGYRKGKDILTVLWINTITNPLVTLIRYLSAQYLPSRNLQTVILIVAEILVVLAEWRLFRRFMSKGRRFFVFSLTMNAASFGLGLLLPSIIQFVHTGLID